MIELNDGCESVGIHNLQALPLTREAFAPFGVVVQAPTEIGHKNLYTHWLGSDNPTMTTRLHVNHVSMSLLPLMLNKMERHPHSAQIFLPLDVVRYVIVVAPHTESGKPDLDQSLAYVAPGNLGIIYRPGVWHATITVLDRSGSFCVLMSRNDSPNDEEFFELDTTLQVQL